MTLLSFQHSQKCIYLIARVRRGRCTWHRECIMRRWRRVLRWLHALPSGRDTRKIRILWLRLISFRMLLLMTQALLMLAEKSQQIWRQRCGDWIACVVGCFRCGRHRRCQIGQVTCMRVGLRNIGRHRLIVVRWTSTSRRVAVLRHVRVELV